MNTVLLPLLNLVEKFGEINATHITLNNSDFSFLQLIVSDPNRSSSDISSDVFLKIVLYPLDTMEVRLKSPDV